MLSFWTFQPIIESWTSCLTFALFHTRASPIDYKTMFNLSFIFNGVDVVIFIKETDLSSWIVWIFEYFLHILNCNKEKSFIKKKSSHIANLKVIRNSFIVSSHSQESWCFHKKLEHDYVRLRYIWACHSELNAWLDNCLTSY